MARANPTWGEERIADELRLKLGLTLSPRTVGRYLRRLRPSRCGRPAQRWATFARNRRSEKTSADLVNTTVLADRHPSEDQRLGPCRPSCGTVRELNARAERRSQRRAALVAVAVGIGFGGFNAIDDFQYARAADSRILVLMPAPR
mgnify:CR=1 FL=1